MPRLEWGLILSTIQVPWEPSEAHHHGISSRAWHLYCGLYSYLNLRSMKDRVWICFPSVNQDEEVEIQRGQDVHLRTYNSSGFR